VEHVITRTVRDSAAMLDSNGERTSEPLHHCSAERPYLEETRAAAAFADCFNAARRSGCRFIRENEKAVLQTR